MKIFCYNIFFFSILFIIPTDINAQQSCAGSLKEFYLNSNNIRASFFPRGNKFTSSDFQANFLAPYPADKRLATIFASSPWVGGFDDAGNLKIAFETYPPVSQEQVNYSVGPLSSIGTLYDSVCTHYNRAWSVYAEDIQAHRLDYYIDFKIDDTIASIFQWPARGNKHFKRYYGFDLPFDNFGLAPFRDMNSNEVYDPENGDYPIVFPYQTSEYIPDQILWMVFNDLSALDESPLRFEIQLTAFAYHCQESSWLNNTIFNKYRILNRAVTSADSMFFGFWTDYDLGCSEDDFVGSDSIRNTEFVYNDNNGDGNPGLDCPGGIATYGYNPPVQSMTYLSHAMHSFIAAGNENEPIEFYRKLNGHWNDNTPLYPIGEGYEPGSTLPPTRFLFHGDPRDENSWSANNVLSEGKGYRTVSSINLGRMDPGAVREILIAYQFHHHPDSNYNGQLSLMYNNIDSLLNTQYLGENCSPFPYCIDDDCVWPGDFDHNGIADHHDYLMWSIMKNNVGPEREGLVTWRPQFGEEWPVTINGINTKHGDANGDGIIEKDDIDINNLNFLSNNGYYEPVITYTDGPELKLQAMPNFSSNGQIRTFSVSAGREIQNVLGIAFEIEFDTSLFASFSGVGRWPDTPYIHTAHLNTPNEFIKAAVVTADKSETDVATGNLIWYGFPNSFSLKPGKTIPDSTTLRLRNAIAIDRFGKYRQLGSNALVIYKELPTGIRKTETEILSISPNPASGHFWIDIPDRSLLEFYSSLGKLVKKIEVLPYEEVNVSDLPVGIYFVRVPEYRLFAKLILQ